jgi:hypothetical protein
VAARNIGQCSLQADSGMYLLKALNLASVGMPRVFVVIHDNAMTALQVGLQITIGTRMTPRKRSRVKRKLNAG